MQHFLYFDMWWNKGKSPAVFLIFCERSAAPQVSWSDSSVSLPFQPLLPHQGKENKRLMLDLKHNVFPLSVTGAYSFIFPLPPVQTVILKKEDVSYKVWNSPDCLPGLRVEVAIYIMLLTLSYFSPHILKYILICNILCTIYCFDWRALHLVRRVIQHHFYLFIYFGITRNHKTQYLQIKLPTKKQWPHSKYFQHISFGFFS